MTQLSQQPDRDARPPTAHAVLPDHETTRRG